MNAQSRYFTDIQHFEQLAVFFNGNSDWLFIMAGMFIDMLIQGSSEENIANLTSIADPENGAVLR